MKAIIPSIPAFDATVNQIIAFTYSGNQPHKNRLLIKNASTLATVYDVTQTTMQFKHTLPANTLTNGAQYTFQIQVLDVNNVANELSNSLLVKCYTTPTFAFINPTEGLYVVSPTIVTTLSYSQLEGEELNECIIRLYDSNKIELSKSETIYDTTALTHTFYGLEDVTNYYVKAFGQTVEKTEIETDYISFTVKYIVPIVQGVVTLTNEPCTASVKVESGIKAIKWESNLEAEEFVYIDNTKVDLRTVGDYIHYYEGFNVDGNFLFQYSISNVNWYSKPLLIGNDFYHISIQFLRHMETGKYFILMVAPSADMANYTAYSDYFDLFDDTEFVLQIKRIDNYYSLKVDGHSIMGIHIDKIYGASTQSGTPTPTSPISILSVADDGDLVITTKNSDETLSSLIIIPLVEPLRSDITGTVKDEIVMRNGLYGVLRRIHNFTPDENWSFDVDTQTYITFTHYTSIGIVPNTTCICTHFSYAEVTNDRTVAIDAISVVDLNTIKICFDSAFSTIKTESDLQTWLATNNVQVQCQLKVPIFEPFNSATQTVLSNFQTTFLPVTCTVTDTVSTTMDYEIINVT